MAPSAYSSWHTRLPALAPRLSAVPTSFLTPGQHVGNHVLKKPLAEMITTPSGDRTRVLIPLGCTQSVLDPQHQATLSNVSDNMALSGVVRDCTVKGRDLAFR